MTASDAATECDVAYWRWRCSWGVGSNVTEKKVDDRACGGLLRARGGCLLRALLAATAICVMVGLVAGQARAAGTWSAIVANSGGESATPFGIPGRVPGKAITIKGTPYAVAVTPNGQTAYVVNDAEPGTVTPIDLTTGAAGTAIDVAPYPIAVAIAPNGLTAYVASNDPDNGASAITPIDLTTGAAEAAITDVGYPNVIAIAPNGQTAYVTTEEREVVPIELAEGEKLGTPIHIPDSTDAGAIAIAPNGQTAYVVSETSKSSELTPIKLATGTAATPIALEANARGVAITPNGKTAYVAIEASSGTIMPIDLETDRAETPLPAGSYSREIAITPDGETAYVTDIGLDLLGTTVTPVNLANGIAETSITVGKGPAGIAITPDQAPTAAFSATAAAAGSPTSFNGSASASVVGSIASYAWTFGDGGNETTNSPTSSHVYASPGVYTATLTVTDSAGTSLSQVFTGQTMSLDGAPQATVSHTITVASPGGGGGSPTPIVSPTPTTPTVSRLSETHSRWHQGKQLASLAKGGAKRKPPVGTTFSFTLDEQAEVQLAFVQELTGRKVAGKCLAASGKAKRGQRCVRTVAAGTLSFAGHAGGDQVVFDGRLSAARSLAQGRYELTVTASASGETSRPASIGFTILPRPKGG